MACSINDHGQVVGCHNPADSAHGHHAVLFDITGNGDNIDLNTVIDPSYSGPYLAFAFDINNDGWIIGAAGEGDNTRGFLLTPIPEPCSICLLVLGGLAFAPKRLTGYIGQERR